jgi:hypothetical protein
MSSNCVLQIFETALGQRPRDVIATGRRLTDIDLESLIAAWRSAIPIAALKEPAAHEIWPIISHHAFDGHTLFRGDAGQTMLPRVLNILLIHDGVVVADPFADLARLVAHDQMDQALALAADVTEGLAPCEALLDRGVLRFTSHRPALTDDARRAVLDVFNVDPAMQVFTNFLEAAVTVDTVPGLFETAYRPQVNELFVRLGFQPPVATTLDEAVSHVRTLATALIEVSWQMAICATDPACDLALITPLELELTNLVLDAATNPSNFTPQLKVGRTRHLARMNAGDLPNLEPAELTVEDALSIRESDAFEEFRQLLRGALDTFGDSLRTGQAESAARAVFEDQMFEGAYTLKHRVGESSLKSRLRDTSVPLVIGAASAGLLAPMGPGFAALGGSVASLSGTVWQWLTARRTPSGFEVAHRYVSMLSGSPRKRR